MNKRAQQKQETRQTIIQAAFNVYAAYGFGASTSQIAKEAHISHGSIFVHFQSRDELLTSLIEQFYHEINFELHAVTKSACTLSDLLQAHIKLLTRYEDFYTQLLLSRHTLPHEAKMQMISLQSTMSLHFSQVINLRPVRDQVKQLPNHILFNTWMAMLHYYLQNKDLFSPEDSVLKTHGKLLIESFLAMIEP